MTRVEHSPVRFPHAAITRRGFVQAGIATSAWSLAGALSGCERPLVRAGCEDRSVIMICNYGGPSQLDSWDPKPAAPQEVRGPYRAISTAVPGIHVSELFPRHAQIAHHVAWIRSCHHDAPAVHALGWHVMQTGYECLGTTLQPHVGCLGQYLLGDRNGLPGHVVLPVSLQGGERRDGTGQMAGYLGQRYEPLSVAWVLAAVGRKKIPHQTHGTSLPAGNAQEDHGARVPGTVSCGVCEPAQLDFLKSGLHRLAACANVADAPPLERQRYGDTRLGRLCLVARRLVEAGVRLVTVNTGGDVYPEESWDVHGTQPFRPLRHLQDSLAPRYDQAVAGLITDLASRGLLDNTLVCCLAEFGRTPRINPDGGRDHWPRCYSIYFAGGGVQGGQVIGASDAMASEPISRPVGPAEIVATIYHSLGMDHRERIATAEGSVYPLVAPGVSPIHELF